MVICFVIRYPIVTAGLKCAIEIFPNTYTPIVTPTNGANAINEISNTPFILAFSTTEPVANKTRVNVPIISAINFF